MCGIYGVLSLNGAATATPEQPRATGAIARHCEPDDHGEDRDGPLAFGRQRLSIIDVSGGHQPIANEDQTVCVACNGEIYNFRELRGIQPQPIPAALPHYLNLGDKPAPLTIFRGIAKLRPTSMFIVKNGDAREKTYWGMQAAPEEGGSLDEWRVPLRDEKMVDLAASMPLRHKISGRDPKHVLNKALTGITLDTILYHQRRGFGGPWGTWFKNELRPLIDQLLSPERIEQQGGFDADPVERLRAEHAANTANNTDELAALVNLKTPAQLNLDARAVDDVCVGREAAAA